MPNLNTQPVPVRVDEGFLLILLNLFHAKLGGSVEFTAADIEQVVKSRNILRVYGEGQKDSQGNVLFDPLSGTPQIDPSAGFKTVTIQTPEPEPQVDPGAGPILVHPEGGPLN